MMFCESRPSNALLFFFFFLYPQIISREKKLAASDKDPEPIEPQDAVLIEFEARVAVDVADAEAVATSKNDDGKVFQQAKGWLVVVGEGDVLPALEMGIRFMETGQTALIWSHAKYALGPGTRSFNDGKSAITVPPRSNVVYKVKVVQKVMDTSRLNPYFTLQKALTRKTIANDIYQHEWCPSPQAPDDPDCQQAMSRAIRLYTKAAKEMESLLEGTYFQQVEADHPQRHQSQQILLDSLNNTAAVYLRQKEYNKAKQAAVNVLSVDSRNLKGLMRAAKAALMDPASSYEEVEAALKAAEDEITYKNPQEEKDLKKLKGQFKRQQQEYKQKTKAMFGNKLATATTESNSCTASPDEAKEGAATAPKVSRGKTDKDTTSHAPKANTTDATLTKGEDAEEKEDDVGSFWWSQLYAIIGQVIIPLILVLLYRFVYLEKREDGPTT